MNGGKPQHQNLWCGGKQRRDIRVLLGGYTRSHFKALDVTAKPRNTAKAQRRSRLVSFRFCGLLRFCGDKGGFETGSNQRNPNLQKSRRACNMSLRTW